MPSVISSPRPPRLSRRYLPPKGLETLKSIACNRALWEDLGNGYVTKKPKKKRTSVQVRKVSPVVEVEAEKLEAAPQTQIRAAISELATALAAATEATKWATRAAPAPRVPATMAAQVHIVVQIQNDS